MCFLAKKNEIKIWCILDNTFSKYWDSDILGDILKKKYWDKGILNRLKPTLIKLQNLLLGS